MALRAELIGPYCLILIMCTVCADQNCKRASAYNLNGANVSIKINCGCPQAYNGMKVSLLLESRVHRSTINSRIRTGTDSGNPTV